MENNRYPELSEQGKVECQLLMDKFEKELKSFALKTMENITTDFYANVTPYIESDHWANYRNSILNDISNYGTLPKYEKDRIRKAIYANHKEEIIKDLNQDLLKEIESLKKTINDYINRQMAQ